ncbi:MAG: rhomboid family intramembrane serine protease [Myxococcota bacterium]|jgi:membrane associated rhomboid family serine protease|nr:hypothetical protein [Deltaproteobacteria bacterium]MCP4241368.1 rhomboid family intramembrane serine protease [bacterium]MDP6074267.1 rhomboid family intramembrane serine protease [Myxococcota bacterium]MDP7074627.1 rhomboid family intramembrane serine protease [Myxococcota bacterium]MDP7299401.1 rhomboid family intramembrane serine protease [Myxococcota bacterium]
MSAVEDSAEEVRLRPGPNIELDNAGFSHPLSPRSTRSGYTRYGEINHIGVSDRGVWIASENDLIVVPHERFAAAGEDTRFAHSLVRRIRRFPDGEARLARMAELDLLGARDARPVATLGLIALCAVGFALDWLVRPAVNLVGSFSPRLTMDGDIWRVVTGNLLHGFPLHFVLNVVGLYILGRMVERVLGSERTVCIMGGAALSAMGLSGWLAPEHVVGISGVVLGLAGALVWIEWRRRSELPAWWRFPRRVRQVVVTALVLDLVLGPLFLPFIAGAAHFGGFIGGAAVAGLMTRRGLIAGPGRLVRVASVSIVAITALAVGAAGLQLSRDDYVAWHLTRLASLEGIPAAELNNAAWFIAIGKEVTEAQLEAALKLAERAVDETGGEHATMIDTLAELQFQLGHSEAAVVTIDRAIALEPEESYYREQRRRFTGERPAHDRPPDPLFRPRERSLPVPALKEGEVPV